ncbi:MAG: cupin domain-containing protein [Negativicutes bacterium]|nr:cupin domain-containing protein [Negativicutes bacterium]
MIIKQAEQPSVQMIAGVQRKTLAVGEKSMLVKFELEAGAVIPPHSHPHEQIGCLLSGRLVFIVDGKEYPAGPGDSWAFPGGVQHAVQVVEQAEVVEVFIPIREDYR